MKKYFKVTDDMTLIDSWLLGILENEDGSEASRWLFCDGTPVQWEKPLSIEVYQDGRSLDLSFNDYSTLITSNKAKLLIEQFAPNAVQFIPLSVPNTQSNFFVANIIDLVDCLNEQQSHVERFVENDPVRPDRAGEISLIVDLHIDPNRALGHHFFRLKGYDVAVIVSDTMKRAFDDAGITGLRYVDVTAE